MDPQRPNGFPLLVSIIAALALAVLLVRPAPAKDHGFPDGPQKAWMESLKMPPYYATSCCGVADGYAVERYIPMPDGSVVVWIDGSEKIFPDGEHRLAWDSSVSILVPKGSVNRAEDDLDNPGDKGVLFFRPKEPAQPADGGPLPPATEWTSIYCLVLHPQDY